MRIAPLLVVVGSVVVSGCVAQVNNEASMQINKVVIPAAGAGTRWHPWTLAMPKEMVPVGSQPGIAHVVKESVESGCLHIVIIANAHKNAIADYFEKVDFPATFTYIPQLKPLGLGHAVMMAEPTIHNEYFGVILPDELLFGQKPGLGQLIEIAKREHASVIAVCEVPWSEVSSYGVIAINKTIDENLFEISGLVEKPKVENAPSNLMLSGRYVLSSKVFDSLHAIKPGAKGEFQLTDAIADMLRKGERVLAYKVKGVRYDVGTPLGWTKAVIGLSLQNPVYRNELLAFIAHEGLTASIENNTDSQVIQP